MRITAAWAAIGAAVGSVLYAALRFAGQSVLAGVSARGGSSGMPRRYVDYVPTSVSLAGGLPLRLLPVAAGTGLVAGLLVGVVVRVVASRRRPARTGSLARAVALALGGLAIGALVAVELYVYGHHTAPAAFGWYAYSPLANSDGVFYSFGSQPSWWLLILAGTLVGLAVGMLVGAVATGVAIWTRRAGQLS